MGEQPPKNPSEVELDAEQTWQAFYNWANEHVAKSHGTLIHSDPERSAAYMNLYEAYYPWDLGKSSEDIQALQHHYRVAAVAEKADRLVRGGDFYQMVEELKVRHQSTLSELKASLAAGESIAVLCNHPDLLNPALIEAAVYCAGDDPHLAKSFLINVNKMLGWLDVVTERGKDSEVIESYPAIEILTGFSNIGCVVPRSDSTSRHGLDNFASRYNKMSRSQLRLFREGTAVFLSASGSLDLMPDPAQGRDHIEMKRANQQVERILSRHIKKAWPILTWVDQESRALSFHIGDITPLDDPQTIHRLMREMEEPYSQMASQSLGLVAVKYAQARPNEP